MVKVLFSLLGILILFHSFSTAPFMVECVRIDGKHLVEIIGNDPCRESHDKIHSLEEPDTGITTIAELAENEKPCTDRYFDNPGNTRESLCSIIDLPMLLGESALCQSSLYVPIVGVDFKLVRKTPPIRGPASSLPLNLRI